MALYSLYSFILIYHALYFPIFSITCPIVTHLRCQHRPASVPIFPILFFFLSCPIFLYIFHNLPYSYPSQLPAQACSWSYIPNIALYLLACPIFPYIFYNLPYSYSSQLPAQAYQWPYIPYIVLFFSLPYISLYFP